MAAYLHKAADQTTDKRQGIVPYSSLARHYAYAPHEDIAIALEELRDPGLDDSLMVTHDFTSLIVSCFGMSVVHSSIESIDSDTSNHW